MAGFSPTQWRQIIDDGGRFLDAWGERAARLNWNVTDVFGLDPRAPGHRHDAMGLVFLIGGGPVTALQESSGMIQRRDSTLTHRRGASAGVWELETADCRRQE